MTHQATLLLSLLLLAHYLGDFTPLATRKMQEAKAGVRPPGLIIVHAAIHGLLVGLAVTITLGSWRLAAAAAGIEFALHFAIDFAKMKTGLRFPILRDSTNDPFWYFLGLDQLAHGLVLLGIARWVL